jgi:hypothetical protein
MRPFNLLSTHGITAVSAVVFVASVILATTVSPYFAILGAVAAFLADLLRLFGVLKDADEFQHEAAGRASRLAIIVAVFLMALMYALYASGAVDAVYAQDAWIVAFAIVLATRYVAYAMMFWDPRTAAPKVFVAFGTFWLVFVVLSNWADWVGMLIQASVVVAPFAVLVLLVGRFPRVVGAASVLAAVAAFLFFDLRQLLLGNIGSLVVFALIPAPLLAIGVGLLTRAPEVQDETENA